MARFYIEPRYNSGERAAGGTLTIAESSEPGAPLLTLYKVSNLDAPDINQFEIDNPARIDNNGINCSPIFFNDEKGTTYYILRDAQNAIIRQGFVHPTTWNGGGLAGDIKADENSPNWGKGEPFWGYEIIESIPALAEKDTGVGRPVWLRTTARKGDKSSGLVVYATEGNVNDGILSFAGNNNRYWKAREKYIDYSYLKGALPSSRDPFDYMNSVNQSLGWNYAMRLDSSETIMAKDIKSNCLHLDTLLIAEGANITIDLKGSDGFPWSMELESPSSEVRLTDSAKANNAYHVKPSEHITVDSTFHAKNAELYNLCDFSSDVKIVHNDAIQAASNLVKISSDSHGSIKLNAKNDGKLYIDSQNIEIIGNGDAKVYVKQARELNSLVALVDHNVMTSDDWPLPAMNRFSSYTAVKILRANDCKFKISTEYSPWVDGFNLYGLEHGEFKNCSFNLSNKFIGSGQSTYSSIWSFGSKFSNCKFRGGERCRPKFWLGDDTDVEGCEFSSIKTILVGSIHSMSNINFNNCKPADGNAGLSFPRSRGHSSIDGYGREPLFDFTDSIIAENVNVKGNYADENGNAFIIETYFEEDNSPINYPLIKGHIEVTGYYDYSQTGGTGLATETFPVRGKNIKEWGDQWIGNGEWIDSLCVYMHGESLKYANLDNGALVVLDPRKPDGAWSNTYPKPKTNYAQFINWQHENEDGSIVAGTTITPVNCLLCCLGKTTLYRIRE
jgi:hypothetical protein